MISVAIANICEDESLVGRQEKLDDQVGQLVLNLLLVSLMRVVKENVILREIADVRRFR
jgi:hypothetical protein